jgi:hypothetical protein
MTASQGWDWDHYNGAIWELTANYYSLLSGGASFLASMFLCFAQGEFRIGDSVGSTNVWAKVSTGTSASHVLVGATGWLDWDGSAFSSVNIAVACAYSLTPSPLPPAPPPSPQQPPPCEYIVMTASSGTH